MESHGSSYDMIIEAVFFAHFVEGGKEFYFNRMEIEETTKQIGVSVPKNIGDVIYTYRYRQKLPQRVLDSAPRGKQWVIRSAGYGKYKFGLTALAVVNPTPGLVETKILNATPGVIARYSLTDEQALLAIVRYNRLLDILLVQHVTLCRVIYELPSQALAKLKLTNFILELIVVVLITLYLYRPKAGRILSV